MLFSDEVVADISWMRRKFTALKMLANKSPGSVVVRVQVAYSLAMYTVSFRASGCSKNSIHPGVWCYKLSL